MAEYIERETAVCVALGATALGNTAYSDRFEIATRLRSIPAADVREVVTCGECVYFRLNSCMRWADGTFMERTDFCSRAAKREES